MLLGMSLARLGRMVGSMSGVTVCDLRVMGSFFVVARLVVLGGFLVVLGGRFMVCGSRRMMVGNLRFHRHSVSPYQVIYRDRPSASRLWTRSWSAPLGVDRLNGWI